MCISLLLSVVFVLIVLTQGSISAAASEVKAHPDFLFTEDNSVPVDQQLGRATVNSIDPSNDINNDKWLNAPLTRLDYILIEIQSI